MGGHVADFAEGADSLMVVNDKVPLLGLDPKVRHIRIILGAGQP